MHYVRPVLVLAIACAMALPAAFGAEGSVMALDPIRRQQALILAGVQAKSGVYADLSARDRKQMVERQTRLLEMIEGKKTSADLEEAEQVELSGTLEWIDATVKGADDERMVCERVRVIGSNMKERVCMTVAQRREATERAREEMTRPQKK